MLSVTAGLVLLVLYLTVAWSIIGRTYGCHVMGLRVVSRRGKRLRPLVALLRAVLYVMFPIGLLFCAGGVGRRSLQDLVLRTSVIYDWLPRSAVTGDHPLRRSRLGLRTCGQQAQLPRPPDGLVAARCAQLAKDAPHVAADRVDRDVHGAGDLFGGQQLGEVLQDLVLLAGQRGGDDQLGPGTPAELARRRGRESGRPGARSHG